MKTIQERLGHSKYFTTANMYAHLMTDSPAKASEKLSALVQQTSEPVEHIS